MTFDVFMSYSSQDRSVVSSLAEALRSNGLDPWFDAEQSVPGRPFQQQLAEGLSTSRCCAVFVGAYGVGDWVREELHAAINKAAKDHKFRVFLVLLPGAPADFDWTTLDPFLSNRTWVDLRAGDAMPEQLARAVRGEPLAWIERARASDDDVCPYVGLRTYTERDAPWFFGRDSDVQRLVEKLRSSQFLGVLGRSGSGKSSVVRAGLLPALASGRAITGSDRWRVRTFTPTAAPLQQLSAQLSVLRPELSTPQTLADLADSDLTLTMLTAAEDDAPVLWIVDQAEELFTLCDDASERRAFADNLLRASQPGGPARVLFALRSDFYPRFSELAALSDRLATHQYVVKALDDDQLSEVVLAPAAAAGLQLEPGLADRIVRDVTGQPGALPLVQHSLYELWEHRDGDTLTHSVYGEIGGVGGALARRADRTLDELEADDRAVARRLLLSLVRPGEGAEDTKQPALLGHLSAPALPIASLHRVTAALADARLVTTGDRDGDTNVEVAHEALIRHWPTLQGWIEESRDELRTRRRLRQAADAWVDADRSEDLLYRGTTLSSAREWASDRWDDLPTTDAAFLRASIDRDESSRLQTQRRRRTLVATLTSLTVLALLGAALATIQWRGARGAEADAQDAADRAQAAARRADQTTVRALTNQARALIATDPALALAVAAEAHARGDDDDTRAALVATHGAFSTHRGHRLTTLPDVDLDQEQPIGISSDGAVIATIRSDGTIDVWDADDNAVQTTIEPPAPVWTVTVSPDGRTIATGGRDGVNLWDAGSGSQVGATITGDAVVFSPAGDMFATIRSRRERVRLWSLTEEGVEQVSESPGWDVAFSADGDMAAISGGRGVELLNARTGRRRHLVKGYGPTFSNDGSTVATSTDDGIALWATDSGEKTGRLKEYGAPVTFVPDDTHLVTAYGDFGGGYAQLWKLDGGEEPKDLAGSRGVATTADGGLVATSDDRDVTLWDMTTYEPASSISGAGTVLRMSTNGKLLVTTSAEDRAIQLWDTTTGAAPVMLRHAGDLIDVYDATFSPDGKIIATISDGPGGDSDVRVWDASSGEEITSIDPRASDVAFSPNGREFAASGSTLRRWDLSTGRELPKVPISADVLAYKPDGRLLAATQRGRDALLLDGETGTELAVLERAGWPALFDPKGRLLATVADAGDVLRLKLWDLQPTPPRVIRESSDDQFPLAFSADGDLFATATEPNARIAIWDVDSGTETPSPVGAGAVAFSPTGVVAVGETRVELKDPTSGTTITRLTGEAKALAFSPDGSRLATDEFDGTVALRPMVTDAASACAAVAGIVAVDELVDAIGDDPSACTDFSLSASRE